MLPAEVDDDSLSLVKIQLLVNEILGEVRLVMRGHTYDYVIDSARSKAR